LKSTMEPKILKSIKSQASRPAFRSFLLLALCGTLMSFSTGCHKKAKGIDPSSLGPTDITSAASTTSAPTATLTADPVAIDLGQTVVLNWRTTNATVVTIEGIGQVNVNGTQTVSPSNSTNFHLVAKGDGGTTDANVRVTVRVPVAPTMANSANKNGADAGAVTESAFHAAVQDVFFDYDSFDVRPDGQTAAQAAAAYLRAHSSVRVLITGYCDERGSAEYNLALGENRANAAKAALIGAGVEAGRIRAFSVGKEKQFCTEANETCWQENRRAQFTIDQ
jgi:peptidoglycan-associated lipoprotein